MMIRFALLTAFFALALTACGEKPANETPAATEETTDGSTAKTLDLGVDLGIDIVGDESASTSDLTTAADDMTGDASK